MSLHLDSINNPSDAEFSVILKTQALERGQLGLNANLGWSEIEGKEAVDDRLPEEEVQRNPFIPDDVYSYFLIRIVSF